MAVGQEMVGDRGQEHVLEYRRGNLRGDQPAQQGLRLIGPLLVDEHRVRAERVADRAVRQDRVHRVGPGPIGTPDLVLGGH